MAILVGVVLLFAVLSVAMAAAQAVAISRVAPSTPWRGWLFGWWRFGEIERRAGTAAAAQAGIYKRAVIAGLVFLIVGLVLSGWMVNPRPQQVAAMAPNNFNGARLDVAVLDNLILRSVASMPGAILVES